jgi:CRP-like cAMP-binding protein
MDIAAFFPAHALLAPLPARARERLMPQAQACNLAAGETSNAAESEGAAIFVTSGVLRASSLQDGAILFHDIEAGGVLGLDEAMLGHEPHAAALLAVSDVTAIVLPASSVLAAIKGSAAASFALALHFAKAMDQRLSACDPLQLVYRDILRAAKPMGETRWTIDPMPRHRDLAQRAGVGEEEAASAIANLVRLGVARRRYPALDIEDREALRSLAR